MQSGEYESLIRVLVGMGGDRTTDELKQAMVARGLSVENVEELLDIAVGKHDGILMTAQRSVINSNGWPVQAINIHRVLQTFG